MLSGSGFQCKGRDSQGQCSLCRVQMRSANRPLVYCSEISFSRTSKSPDLISYIYRIASVTIGGGTGGAHGPRPTHFYFWGGLAPHF